MIGLSHAVVAGGRLVSAVIVGLRLSGPAGSVAAATPGADPGPRGRGWLPGRRTPTRCRASTGRWGR